tara:strand:- start:383 stop:571 length:189 start_codon:yes stop_codon:yes gene_type:complete
MSYGKLWYGRFMFKDIENWEYVIDGYFYCMKYEWDENKNHLNIENILLISMMQKKYLMMVVV